MLPVPHHLEMQMRTRAASGRTELADPFAALHLFAGIDGYFLEMHIDAAQSVPMAQHDVVALAAVEAALRDRAVAGVIDGISCRAVDVDARMEQIGRASCRERV